MAYGICNFLDQDSNLCHPDAPLSRTKLHQRLHITTVVRSKYYSLAMI
jgi:hypothetical protein